MGDSVPITITVFAPDVQTYIVNYDMQPRSGQMPLTVSFQGYLTRYSGIKETSPNPVNGETVEIQILNSSNNTWQPTGVTAGTGPDELGPIFHHGFFSGQIIIDPAYTPPGSYQFKAHYGGNVAKQLLGCETSPRSIVTNGVGGEFPWGLVAIGGLAVVAVGAYSLKKKSIKKKKG